MGHRILVIDDEPVLRLTFRYFLEQEGYEVRVAANGREGLEQCREQPPELVITDLCMPDLSGYDTIERLHQEQPELPIIAMSALAGSQGREHTLERGATCCITKPIDMAALLRLVDSIMKLPHTAEASAG